MKIKTGVSIAGLNPCMRRALIECDRVMKKYGVDFVITSGLEGVHSAGSLHYYGFAIDARTRDLEDNLQSAYTELKASLLEYDVVLERTHLHIENEIAFKEALCKSNT